MKMLPAATLSEGVGHTRLPPTFRLFFTQNIGVCTSGTIPKSMSLAMSVRPPSIYGPFFFLFFVENQYVDF